MFTCSSCGYEANPDSAPACSLCGTKRPGKAGGSKSEADAPKAAAKAAEPASTPTKSASASPRPSSSSSASPRPASTSSASARPASSSSSSKKNPEGLDELAQAVAATADQPMAETSKGAKGRSARASDGRSAVVTAQGVLRLSTPPPPIDNALTMMGVLAGGLTGYVIEWRQIGHAPGALSEIWISAAIAFGCALIARLIVAPGLENKLDARTKESIHGPLAGLTGALFAVFMLTAFVMASRTAALPPDAAMQGRVIESASGELVAQRFALLTPWSLSLKTEKYVCFTAKGKSEVRIPRAKLTHDDVLTISKQSGLSLTELDKLAAGDPSPPPATPLPPDFSVEAFLDRLSYFGVVADKARLNDARTGTLLMRRRSAGRDELLSLTPAPKFVGELRPALPAGVPLWVGLSFGIKHESNPDHEAFVAEAIEKFRPND